MKCNYALHWGSLLALAEMAIILVGSAAADDGCSVVVFVARIQLRCMLRDVQLLQLK